MTYDHRPRLRWDARRQIWRGWNQYHNRWTADVVRKCATCGGEFIGPNNQRLCDPCGRPLQLQRRAITTAAHQLVARAKRDGELPLLDGSVACVDCGAKAVGYDHRDYSTPLEVEPVCQRCNARRGPAVGLGHLSRRTARGTAA